METDHAHFALTLSRLDMTTQGSYNVNTQTGIPVPEELTVERKRLPHNKCILLEEESVPLSELRWELHIVPEWSWVDIFPRSVVDEVYRACAVMGINFGSAPSQVFLFRRLSFSQSTLKRRRRGLTGPEWPLAAQRSSFIAER